MAEQLCRNCSTPLDLSVSYCEQCGENNPYYVKPLKKEREAYQPSYSSTHTSTQRSYNTTPKQEGSGAGWLILGLFFPFIGFILYFVFKQEKPIAANRSLTGAIIGVVLNIFVYI